MDDYVVCVDSIWIRNAEIFDTEGLPDGALTDTSLLYDEYDMDDDSKWHTMEPTPFVAAVKAGSEEDACEMAASQNGYDPRCLFARKISG